MPFRLTIQALWLSFLLFLSPASFSQHSRAGTNIIFNQLNTSQGLSDNYIVDMCMDKSGNLWIATGEGLNMFNGKTVTKFFKTDYPQFRSDFGKAVVCDLHNRVWSLDRAGFVTLIDEERKVHRISLLENNKILEVKAISRSPNEGVYLFTPHGIFEMNEKNDLSRTDSLTNDHFVKLAINGFDSIGSQNLLRVFRYDRANYLLVVPDGFYKVDTGNGKAEKKYNLPQASILAVDNKTLLICDRKNGSFQLLVPESGMKDTPLQGIKDQFGDTLSARVTNARYINGSNILLTTFKQGLYIFNLFTRKLTRYQHNAADQTTIVNNNPSVILADSSGWVFIGATPNGISYFNSHAVIGQQLIFQDKLGHNYDGYINNIATRDNDIYYIGVSDNLLEWKRSTNTTNFLDYGAGAGKSLMNKEGVSFVSFDSKDRLWVATGTEGIFVLDRNKKLVKHLETDTSKANHVPAGFIWHMKMQPDGYMWVAGRGGICRVNVNTFETDHFRNQPLALLDQYECHMSFFSDPDHLWVPTQNKGLWSYEFSTRKFRNYNSAHGLPSEDALCVNKDNFGNIYVGTAEGLCIFLKKGGIKTVTVKDGLQNGRVEALLLDQNNRMWMGNDVGLSCFNIADSSLRIFDERYGLSIQGFRIGSYHQNSDGELIWGTERGIQYFYPDDLLSQRITLRSVIQRVETAAGVHDLTSSADLDLPAGDNAVNFYFSSIEYSPSLRTFYRYKLEGIDKDWVGIIDQNSVRYSSLPPGRYEFRVEASNDGKQWKEAENTVTISIAKPLLQQWWVKLAGIILGIAVITIVLNFYRRKQERKQNELESELVITYFASQINRHHHIDDLLWDVAKNCISRLQFEDCVIYLKDGERNVLEQKAAYGPKNPVDFTIHRPLEIAVGDGIVGAVAKTGKYELVENTEADPRYILDDQKRLSEIAVPIILDGEVIGVIDSEHSQRNFFTPRHLQILSTVAVLCANQIQRTRAEQEKQKAGMELLENRQKATESRLQSLRLQMNPHFLFNALNSIQQMILAREDIVATKYLSRFSRLLRAILVHSDKETISLKEELDILHLYIELESIRFKESFSYKISVNSQIEPDEVRIPTLLVQPFVENAIWHGLMHKEGERILKVEFTEEGDFIRCSIEDNGIGRKRSAEMKINSGQDKKHTSKGIAVSMERLKALRTTDGREGNIIIIDLADANGVARGTKVEILFPIQN